MTDNRRAGEPDLDTEEDIVGNAASHNSSTHWSGDSRRYHESQLGQLLDEISNVDPFVKTCIVVPNTACQRWMRGILSGCGSFSYASGYSNAGYAGIDILTPFQFVYRVGTEWFYAKPENWGMVRQGRDTVDLLLRYLAPVYSERLKPGRHPDQEGESIEAGSDVLADYNLAGALVDVFHQLSTVATSTIERYACSDDTDGYICKLVLELRNRLNQLGIALDTDIVEAYREWVADTTATDTDISSLFRSGSAGLPDKVIAYALQENRDGLEEISKGLGDPFSDLVLQYPGLMSIGAAGSRAGNCKVQPVFEEVISCHDIDGEVRAIVQAVIKELEAGVAPSDLCILYPSPQPYRRLFIQYLRQWDIPCTAAEQTSLTTYPIPRLFTGLLDAIDHHWDRKAVSRWLSDMGITMQWIAGVLGSFSELHSIYAEHVSVDNNISLLKSYTESARAFIEMARLLDKLSIHTGSHGWIDLLEAGLSSDAAAKERSASEYSAKGHVAKDGSVASTATRHVFEFLHGLERIYDPSGKQSWKQFESLSGSMLDNLFGLLMPSWMEELVNTFNGMGGDHNIDSASFGRYRTLREFHDTAVEIKRVITRIGEVHRLHIDGPATSLDLTEYSKGNLVNEFFSLFKEELASVQYGSAARLSTSDDELLGVGDYEGGDDEFGADDYLPYSPASGIDGVFLGTLGQSVGMLFERVFIAGLNADRFPPPPPLVCRLLSNGVRGSLGLPDDQYYVNRAKSNLVDAMLSSAKGVITTFHRWDEKRGDDIQSYLVNDFIDDSTGSRQSISFVGDLAGNGHYLSIAELAFRLLDVSLDVSLDGSLGGTPKCSLPVVSSRLQTDGDTSEEELLLRAGEIARAGEMVQGEEAIREGRVAQGGQAVEQGEPVQGKELAPEELLCDRISRCTSVISSRISSLFTAFDGRLDNSCVINLDTEFQADDTDAGSSHHYDGSDTHDMSPVKNRTTGVSATQLETYATCPRRYLFERIISLHDRYVPEESDSLPPVSEGTIIHKILEIYVDRRLHGDIGGRDLMMGIASQYLDEVPTDTFVGHPFLWGRTRKRILEELDRFVDEETKFEKSYSVSPVAAEALFGMPSAESLNNYPSCHYQLLDGRVVDLRGKIDRLDCSADGRRIFVTDYKTGKQDSLSRLCKDPVDRGRHLQMFVYGHVAKDVLAAVRGSGGNDETLQDEQTPQVSAQYWLISRSRAASKYIMDLGDQAIERFDWALERLLTSIGEGKFPAIPGAKRSFDANNSFDNCNSCAVRRLCPPSRDRIWERKKEELTAEGATLMELLEGGDNNTNLNGIVEQLR